VDLKTLTASVLAAITIGDFSTVYALVSVARDELGLKFEISPIAVEEALRQLAEEGYVVEYEEMSLDLKKKIKNYIITGKIKELAKPLPPKTQRLTQLKYVTPTFYYLLNQTPK
jgi:DNA-binding transcriptional regulator YhcF (GntR family)